MTNITQNSRARSDIIKNIVKSMGISSKTRVLLLEVIHQQYTMRQLHKIMLFGQLIKNSTLRKFIDLSSHCKLATFFSFSFIVSTKVKKTQNIQFFALVSFLEI